MFFKDKGFVVAVVLPGVFVLLRRIGLRDSVHSKQPFHTENLQLDEETQYQTAVEESFQVNM